MPDGRKDNQFSYRQLLLLQLRFGDEGPPALDALHLEDVDLGYAAVSLQEVRCALLGRLGPTGESVQIKCHRSCREKGRGSGKSRERNFKTSSLQVL